jgi:hypothetical protein
MSGTLPIGDLAGARLESGELAEHALAHVRRGWAVFPLAPKSKVPLIAKRFGGRGCHDATREPAQVTKWWAECPHANIGIATGAPSGFFVLDVDPRHDGDKTLSALIQQHGPLPDTIVSLTGGGGRHFLFRHVTGIGNSASRLGAGIDVRGDSGYVVAPPSTHENGRKYAWDVNYAPNETAIAAAPTWLLARSLLPVSRKAQAELPENWRRLVSEGMHEGGRNSAIARLAGHLFRRRVDPLVVLDLVRCWNAARCRPPLDDVELVRTVDSIAAAEVRRRSAE